jgi:hypothetical protein
MHRAISITLPRQRPHADPLIQEARDRHRRRRRRLLWAALVLAVAVAAYGGLRWRGGGPGPAPSGAAGGASSRVSASAGLVRGRGASRYAGLCALRPDRELGVNDPVPRQTGGFPATDDDCTRAKGCDRFRHAVVAAGEAKVDAATTSAEDRPHAHPRGLRRQPDTWSCLGVAWGELAGGVVRQRLCLLWLSDPAARDVARAERELAGTTFPTWSLGR